MSKFPKNFVWGTSTSAYQIEGAWLEGGKGLSIWDVFTHTPGKILNDDLADVTSDHYYKFEEDIELLKKLGVNAYRFSIAWPRIQPSGYGKVNDEGIKFYSNIIDLLLKNNIEPWITLHHWDLPAILQFEKDGWLNNEMADYFAEYANICFSEFGDRVTKWITFNEPWVTAILGYAKGEFAPGRKSNIEPYIVAHNLLRAHGKAADIYRSKYKPIQQGIIGMANNCDWREPRTNSIKDKKAAQRSLEFFLGWFTDPIYLGDYPKSMREIIGERLPEFTEEDISLIKDSCDFFGINHYTTMYAENAENFDNNNEIYSNSGVIEDERVILTSDDDWEKTTMDWNIVPWGLSKLLKWINHRYNKPEIYITENGASFPDKLTNGKVEDNNRVAYLNSYLSEVEKVIKEGVNVKGYFVWSLLDNFEWTSGYSKRFGLHYVDYETLERIPKKSAEWYKNIILNNKI